MASKTNQTSSTPTTEVNSKFTIDENERVDNKNSKINTSAGDYHKPDHSNNELKSPEELVQDLQKSLDQANKNVLELKSVMNGLNQENDEDSDKILADAVQKTGLNRLKKKKNLKDRNKDLEKELDELKTQLSKAKEKIAIDEKELNDKNIEIQTLDKIIQSVTSNLRIEEKAKILNKESSITSIDDNTHENINAQSEAKMTEETSKLLKEKDDEINKLKKDLSESQMKNNISENQLVDSVNEKNDLKAKLNEINKKYKDLMSKYEEIKLAMEIMKDL